jgi:pimeloyl-ACP methyl ester carboxylesterase
MPTKYVHLDDDRAINVVHAGATTLPHLPPAMRRGAALVFLHGEGGSAQLWAKQLAHFGGAHSPVAIDLPGHGR